MAERVAGGMGLDGRPARQHYRSAGVLGAGIYENGVWKPTRLWNGDETDRGLCFYEKPTVVHVKMQRF